MVNMLKKAWESWKAFARKVGDFQTRIVLTLFYFVVVAPFGLALRTFSDPLGMKCQAVASFWVPREPREVNLEEAGRQF